jgi:hypothetical protein
MRRIPISKGIRFASKGQSFVELSLVVLLLALLVAGIAEYGFLLNRYLNLLDGVREGARYSSNFDPFPPCGSASATLDADGVCSDFYENTALETGAVVYPVNLDPVVTASHPLGDEILISFFIKYNNGAFIRYPQYEGENGWSWGEEMTTGTRNQNSRLSTSDIQGRMDPAAPNMHVLLVEVVYNYPQTLRLPIFQQFIPDPITVYTYAIMPIKNLTCPAGPGTC